jgi:hypothetical protein
VFMDGGWVEVWVLRLGIDAELLADTAV